MTKRLSPSSEAGNTSMEIRPVPVAGGVLVGGLEVGGVLVGGLEVGGVLVGGLEVGGVLVGGVEVAVETGGLLVVVVV